jgi:hypothetical protein
VAIKIANAKDAITTELAMENVSLRFVARDRVDRYAEMLFEVGIA